MMAMSQEDRMTVATVAAAIREDRERAQREADWQSALLGAGFCPVCERKLQAVPGGKQCPAGHIDI